MKLTNKPALLLLTILSIQVLFVRAQSNLAFYQTPDKFNSSAYNPAFLTSQHNFSFSIFPLSGMSVGYNNQDVIRKMMLNILQGDSMKNNLNDVFKQLVKRGIFYQRFESQLFSFGYNSAYGSFDFQVKEVEQIMSNLKGHFSDFITNPAYHTLALNQLQSFPVNAAYYREYSLGYAKEIIPERLSVGIRAKLYFGKSTAYSDVQGELTQASSNFYLKTNGAVKLSFPLNIVEGTDSVPTGGNLPANFTVGKFLMDSKNVGAGIDLGFKYKVNSRVTVSASVTDLGKIGWKNNLSIMNFVGSYKFQPNYISKDKTGTGYITTDPTFSTNSLRIPELFKTTLGNKSFSTPLPTTFYAGAQYQLTPDLIIGLVDRYISSKGMGFNSISISGTFDVKKGLEISAGYSIVGNSFVNIPFGLIHNWEGGQFFIGADNLMSFVFPKITDFSGITFGTCIYLFRGKERYDKRLDYLPFYKQKKQKRAGKNGLQN